MDAAAEQASELLKSLANRHRLMIVCQLIESEQSVGGMADYLGIRDSTVSQHLALLRKDGIVSASRDGQTIWYSIASGPAREILKTLYRIYCGPHPICELGVNESASIAQKRKRIKRNDRSQPSTKSHAARRT